MVKMLDESLLQQTVEIGLRNVYVVPYVYCTIASITHLDGTWNTMLASIDANGERSSGMSPFYNAFPLPFYNASPLCNLGPQCVH